MTEYGFNHRARATPFGVGYTVWSLDNDTVGEKPVGYLVNLGAHSHPVWAAYDLGGREVLEQAAPTRRAALQGLSDALAARAAKRRAKR